MATFARLMESKKIIEGFRRGRVHTKQLIFHWQNNKTISGELND